MLLDPHRLAPDPSDPAIAEVMRDEVVFVLPTTPIDAAAKLMADNDLTEIVVMTDRRAVGYVAAADILDRLEVGDLTTAGSDFAMRPANTEVQARDVMRTPMLLVDERQRVSDVMSIMQRHNRQTALITHDDETPIGLVTPVEIGAYAAAHLLREPVGLTGPAHG